MSKRRKNAGEGYGYMFSGAFAKKADAVKKEKKRKGSFVKAVMMKHGMRYAVMTPRLNPIKRRKHSAPVRWVAKIRSRDGNVREATAEATTRRLALELIGVQTVVSDRIVSLKKATGRENPSELLVMAANPSPENREISVPAGSTVTIRMNPVQVNPLCGAMIGGEPCSRQPGHRGPHLPQGATMRPRSRLRSGWKPRSVNPSAAAIRESFTGAPVGRVQVQSEPHMRAGDYAKLGTLLALHIKPESGGQVYAIEFAKNRPIVVSDETARQLYFVGGDQGLGKEIQVFGANQRGGLLVLGEARRIDYKQRKQHVEQPELDEWRHDFGEESGVRPTVLYDRTNKRILLEGGEYVIRAEGITN